MTPTSLAVFLQSSHPNIFCVFVDRRDGFNVILPSIHYLLRIRLLTNWHKEPLHTHQASTIFPREKTKHVEWCLHPNFWHNEQGLPVQSKQNLFFAESFCYMLFLLSNNRILLLFIPECMMKANRYLKRWVSMWNTTVRLSRANAEMSVVNVWIIFHSSENVAVLSNNLITTVELLSHLDTSNQRLQIRSRDTSLDERSLCLKREVVHRN